MAQAQHTSTSQLLCFVCLLRQLPRPRASMSGTVVSAMDLVKAVDATVKAAAENEPSRAVDSLQFLTKLDVTASLLLSTGAGKKVRCVVDANGIHRNMQAFNLVPEQGVVGSHHGAATRMM